MINYFKRNKGKLGGSAAIATLISMLAFNGGWLVVAGFWIGVFVVCMLAAHGFDLSDSESGNIG